MNEPAAWREGIVDTRRVGRAGAGVVARDPVERISGRGVSQHDLEGGGASSQGADEGAPRRR